MSWLRISDDFTDRQELLELGDQEAIAGWTYMRLLCWSAAHLSDGLVPIGVARREDPAGVAALEGIGYVARRPDGGLDLPRFLTDHHLSRVAVLELREERARAGAKGGKASARAKAEARAQALAEANGKHGAKQNGNPVSRLPSPENPEVPEPVSLPSRATRDGQKETVRSSIDKAVTRV
jgi:hypothetical protein